MLKPDDSVPDEDGTLEHILKNVAIIGDKKSVTSQLEELWEQTGGFGTLLFLKHDFDDLDRWQRCVRVLAEDIVPSLPSV